MLVPIWRCVTCKMVETPSFNVLQMAISAVTDAYGKGTDHADRMRSCTKVIQLMLRTWSGMFDTYIPHVLDSLRSISQA